MNGSLQDRIQEFIQHLGITNHQFATQVGHNGAKLLQVNTSGGPLPDVRISLLLKIISRYPELNLDWLLTGDGCMLKSAAAFEVPLQNEITGLPPQPRPGWKAQLLAAQQQRQTVPLVEQKAYASYLAGFMEEDYLETRPTIYYPELRGIGPIIAIRVQGESMYPTILPDDVLLCSYVEGGQKLKEGSVYVVCHTEGVVVKRIVDYRPDAGLIWCKSDNGEFPTFSVAWQEVRHIWRVRRRITSFLELLPPINEPAMAFQQQLSSQQQHLHRPPTQA